MSTSTVIRSLGGAASTASECAALLFGGTAVRAAEGISFAGQDPLRRRATVRLGPLQQSPFAETRPQPAAYAIRHRGR